MSYLQYTTYAGYAYFWYILSCCNKDTVKNYMYDAGKRLSNKMKAFPLWDQYVEPFIIKQFSVLFAGGHSFIKGLITDNENVADINNNVTEMVDIINEEISQSDTNNTVAESDKVVDDNNEANDDADDENDEKTSEEANE